MKMPVSLIPLLKPIRPQMEHVHQLLEHATNEVAEPLRSMLRRSLGGGKQLRPALVILTGEVFEAPPAPFYKLAAAVDMLHAATLIHDDLVDGASLRRGQETLHTVWSVGVAVLTGDYLLGEATAMVARLGNPRVIEVFAGVLRTMCTGEIERMLTVGKGLCTSSTGQAARWREDYYRNVEAKTASLFAATTEMAAILARAEERQIDALRSFGRELGTAFQIVDDVLDITADDARLGKPAGSDLRHGLITLPIICYLERTKNTNSVRDVLTGERDEPRVRAALEAIRASGAIEAAMAEAHRHTKRGQEALASLPATPSRHTLHALARYVVDRSL